MLHAVLTGDIVNSTLLPSSQEKALLAQLKSLFSPYKYEFFRGDSFQVFLEKPVNSLSLALKCRTAAIRMMPENSDIKTDVRVSIGLGSVVKPVSSLATAKGEAFLLSGRALDELEKTEGRLIIVTENKLAAVTLAVVSDYINSICRQMTQKQAEVIFELLHGYTQQQVADKLNKSKSTISQHVTAGKWDEIDKILVNFEKIVQLMSL